MIRLSPNSAYNPSVARNTPPRGPTSSPRITTRSSASMSSRWTVRTVSTIVCSGAPSVRRGHGRRRRATCGVAHTWSNAVGRVGVRCGLGPRDGVVDLGAHRRIDRLLLRLRQQPLLDEVRPQTPERVLLAPTLDLLGAAVGAVVVVGRVGEVAVGLALDERRPLTTPRPPQRGVHRAVAVERFVAVDDHAGEPVAVRVLRDVAHRRLLVERDRDGVAVVLADEHERDAVDAGEVARLVEVALRRGAVAEEADDGPVLVPQLHRLGHARGVGDVGGDRRRARDDAEPPRSPVAGHLPPARARVGRFGEHPEQHLVGGQPEGEHHAEVAVVGQDRVQCRGRWPRPRRPGSPRGPGWRRRTAPCPSGSAPRPSGRGPGRPASCGTCRAGRRGSGRAACGGPRGGGRAAPTVRGSVPWRRHEGTHWRARGPVVPFD